MLGPGYVAEGGVEDSKYMKIKSWYLLLENISLQDYVEFHQWEI